MGGVEWSELEQLADDLENPLAGPDVVSDVQWRKLEQTTALLRKQCDHAGIIRLRILFTGACTRDTFTGNALIQQLEEAAIHAAMQLSDNKHLAIFWGDKGHNLHRQGLHREAIEVFDISSGYYKAQGNTDYVLRNQLMVALCSRALNQRDRAYGITAEILEQLPEDDPWRGQPLQVLAWLNKDGGNLAIAETLLREALDWQEQSENSDILVAGSLADLGELLCMQGRFDEAKSVFGQSLSILEQHRGQYHRQEARTKMKLAEMYSRQREYQSAIQCLQEADELCCMYGHYYDQLWKIELLMAGVLLHIGAFRPAVGKISSALYIRQQLKLPIWLLVRQILVRYLNTTAYGF